MYLKQIEMENFKSFGGKLTIPLMEGYIAVTGPNGSGKSNISDAILFVLGPRSSKAIRAGRLTDLIFDGGKSKNPATHTRVSLVFDNQDRMIPWDSDEVKLTRLVRLSADGEGYYSYFYVNDIKSTLNEFDNLLSSARISADGYNLVQQGDVTRIVEMGNIERRRILENISGISRFDGDIERAQDERRQAEENIDRITIILTELESQLQQLAEDRDAAVKYMELRDRLEMAKAQMSHRSLEATVAEALSIQEQIVAYDAEIGSMSEELQKAREEALEWGREQERIEREIDERGGQEYQELKARMGELQVDIAREKDRKERRQEEIEEAALEQEEIQAELDLAREEISAADEDVSKKESELSAKREEQESLQTQLSDIRSEIESRGGDMAALQKDIGEAEEGIQVLEDREREASVEVSRERMRQEEMELSIVGLEERQRTAEFELGDAEWNLKEMGSGDGSSAQRLSALGERFQELRKERRELEEDGEDLDNAIRRLTRELETLQAQKTAAENLEKGYSRAVSEILQMRDQGVLRGIHGTIAELAEVDEEFETALNVAAGGRMQAVVVDDDEAAAQAIDYLKRNRLGRVTFLPLSKMREGRPRAKAIMIEKECVGYAIDLIRFDPLYRPAFWHVLSDTLIVDSLSQARSLMGGVRLVTTAGEVLEASGAMVGGTISRGGMRFGAASETRLDSLREELAQARQADEILRERLRSMGEEMRRVEEEIRELQEGGSEARDELRRLEMERDSWQEKRDAIRGELAEKREQLNAIRAEESARQKDLESAQEELNELREKLRGMRARMSEMAPDEIQRQMQSLQDGIIEITAACGSLEGDVREAKAVLSSLRERRESLDKELGESLSQVEVWKKEVEDFAAREKEAEVGLEALRRIEASMEGEVQELRKKRDNAYQSKVNKESERDQLSERLQTKRDFRAGLEAKAALAKEKESQIREEIALIEIEVERPLPSLEELRRTMRSVEGRMAKMGAVNLRAVEDYEIKEERHRRFMGEMSRLEDQKQELLELMSSLEQEKEVIFRQVFVAVDANFQRIYAELSGGGEAHLHLENEKAIFEGGMMINAKPKNGKMLRLEALSGGEKSLTALAFIFAIQEYQPSPFYLLDEVDMFLDSVNAEMVARRVQKSSARAQFVQISLRKVTLGRSEHLIGVTRQPNGVSKVIIQPNVASLGELEAEKQEEVKT